MRPCTMDIQLPGAQSPRTVSCSVIAFTSHTRGGISVGAVAEGRADPLATIRVDLRPDPGDLAGAGFDSAQSSEVKAVASGEARSFSIECSKGRKGSATVTIDAAWASGKNAADGSKTWQIHGSARATVVDCANGETALVVAQF
jgi:hypothetical protein